MPNSAAIEDFERGYAIRFHLRQTDDYDRFEAFRKEVAAQGMGYFLAYEPQTGDVLIYRFKNGEVIESQLRPGQEPAAPSTPAT